MQGEIERTRRIEDALCQCSADLGGELLHPVVYEQWRSSLRGPFSVPTALAIAGSAKDFASVCAGFGIGATARSPRPGLEPPLEPPTRSVEQVWGQAAVTDALRRCATDLDITPSPKSYEAWRMRQEDPWSLPPVSVIVAKGWRWQMALTGPQSRSPSRTDAEIWAHVQLIRDRLGGRVTRAEYERFRVENMELGLASASTLRVRTGRTWSQLFGSKVQPETGCTQAAR